MKYLICEFYLSFFQRELSLKNHGSDQSCCNIECMALIKGIRRQGRLHNPCSALHITCFDGWMDGCVEIPSVKNLSFMTIVRWATLYKFNLHVYENSGLNYVHFTKEHRKVRHTCTMICPIQTCLQVPNSQLYKHKSHQIQAEYFLF